MRALNKLRQLLRRRDGVEAVRTLLARHIKRSGDACVEVAGANIAGAHGPSHRRLGGIGGGREGKGRIRH